MPVKLVTINDLDDSQIGVVKMQPFDGSVFVSGPPGSGKTSVAILRTRMLLDNGVSNVLFLLYNHSLYGYLKKIFSKMNIRQNVNIETKDIFFWNLYGSLGYRFPKGFNYEDKYYQILNSLNEINESDLPKYTLLILDESQDFSRMELQLLRKMSNRMVVLADFDQQVYGKTVDASCFSDLPHRELNTIYRFGKEIARIAQPFSSSGINLERKVTKRGNTPAYKVVTTTLKELDVMCQIIKNKTVADGTMAILAPKRDQLQDLSRKLSAKRIDHFFAEYNNRNLRDYDYDSKRPLLITALSAKGMEFDTVVLYQFNEYDVFGDINKMIYLSLTRTCGELYVIQTEKTCHSLKNLPGLKIMDEHNESDINDF
ncbi:MAG: AAA family ATPase [Bacteroidales bacterium]|nr:AAA family ATPase [Bacteroidales bacterium]